MAEPLGLRAIAGRARLLVCSKSLQQTPRSPPPFRPILIVRQDYHANVAYLASRQTRGRRRLRLLIEELAGVTRLRGAHRLFKY